MTFNELRKKCKNYPLFKLEDVLKWFPEAKKQTTLNQLSFWIKNNWVEQVRRGVYILKDSKIEEPFIIANFIYSPSYVSLESALNYYSIMPDIPFSTTSVTTRKTKKFRTKGYGIFYYKHLKPDLFFGYKTILIKKNYSYNIASQEKAIFDYFYLQREKIISPEGFIKELRLTLTKKFNWKKFLDWTKFVPARNKNFHNLINTFIQQYGK